MKAYQIMSALICGNWHCYNRSLYEAAIERQKEEIARRYWHHITSLELQEKNRKKQLKKRPRALTKSLIEE